MVYIGGRQTSALSCLQSATPKEIPTTELYKETERDSLSLFVLENFLQIQILHYTDNQ